MSGYTSDAFRGWQGTPGAPSIKNAWGTFLNDNTGIVAQLAVGYVAVSIGGLTTYTLTTANASSDQARPLMQDYTGALGGACTVTIPNVQKVGWSRNSTTGGQNVLLTSGGGTQGTLPPDGNWYYYWCDGSGNVSIIAIAATNPLLKTQAWQEIATYTLTGAGSQTLQLSGFSRYRFTFQGLTVNTSTAFMEARFSLNGGGVFITTGYAQFGMNTTVSGTVIGFDQTGASALLTLGLSTQTGSTADGVFEVYPGTASLQAMCNGRSSFFSSNSFWGTGQFSNTLSVSGPVNAVQIFPSGGTFSGTIIQEGLP